MRNSKFVFVFAFALSVNASAERPSGEFRVNPSELNEFSKPLPEILVFSEKEGCIYKSNGFGSENKFFSVLDYLFGLPIEFMPSGESKSEFIEGLNKNNPDRKLISIEKQDEIVRSISTQMHTNLNSAGCDISLDDVTSVIIDESGNALKAESIPKATYTIVSYSADWCVPCHKQKDSLVKYLKKRDVSVGWLVVERDSQKL